MTEVSEKIRKVRFADVYPGSEGGPEWIIVADGEMQEMACSAFPEGSCVAVTPEQWKVIEKSRESERRHWYESLYTEMSFDEAIGSGWDGGVTEEVDVEAEPPDSRLTALGMEGAVRLAAFLSSAESGWGLMRGTELSGEALDAAALASMGYVRKGNVEMDRKRKYENASWGEVYLASDGESRSSRAYPVVVIQDRTTARGRDSVLAARVRENKDNPGSSQLVPIGRSYGFSTEMCADLGDIFPVPKESLVLYLGSVTDGEVREKIWECLRYEFGIRVSKRNNSIRMALCPRCLRQMSGPNVRIRRADLMQESRETCYICQKEPGYDYFVTKLR
ncbi:MAG: hypothetical protein ACOX6J_03210 [Oscillospiraceae bacterium]|jgi:hypothetical protein